MALSVSLALTIIGPTVALGFQCRSTGECSCENTNQNITLKFALPDRKEPVLFSLDEKYIPLPEFWAYRANPNAATDGLLVEMDYITRSPWPRSLLRHYKYGPYLSISYHPRSLEKALRVMVRLIEGREISDSDKFVEVASEYGLSELILNRRPTELYWNGSLYVNRSVDGTLDTYIYCDPAPDDPDRFRQCRALSAGDPVTFEYRFLHTNLSLWDQFRSSGRSLLKCMVTPTRRNQGQ